MRNERQLQKTTKTTTKTTTTKTTTTTTTTTTTKTIPNLSTVTTPSPNSIRDLTVDYLVVIDPSTIKFMLTLFPDNVDKINDFMNIVFSNVIVQV
jgi:hypothetical protein